MPDKIYRWMGKDLHEMSPIELLSTAQEAITMNVEFFHKLNKEQKLHIETKVALAKAERPKPSWFSTMRGIK